MKRNALLLSVIGLILTISFQNCSKGNFQASSESPTTQSEKIVVSDDQVQDWLDQKQAYICPAIRCAAPPEGYHYEEDNSVDSLCPTSCGRLVPNKIGGIRQHPIACPAILCSAVPEGCKRVAAANTTKDVNGCNLSCGEIVCEDKSGVDSPTDQLFGAQEEARIRCPAIRCAPAPANCYYRQNSVREKRELCPTCGELICKKVPFGTDLPPVPAE